jgi:hypothetical protein
MSLAGMDMSRTELNPGRPEFRQSATESNPGRPELRQGATELNPGRLELQRAATELNRDGIESREGASESNPGRLESREGASKGDSGGVARTAAEKIVSTDRAFKRFPFSKGHAASRTHPKKGSVMNTTNRSTLKTRNANVAAGIDKHIPSPITVGGVSYTPPTLKAVFAAHTAALDASDALHKQWTDQVVVADAAGDKANETYQSLRSYLIGQYGKNANAVLNDFGMSAPKPTGPKTVKMKAEAADKRAATRAARHTMGKNQKKAVTGATGAAAGAGPAAGAAPAAPTPPATTPGATPGATAVPTPSPAKPVTPG